MAFEFVNYNFNVMILINNCMIISLECLEVMTMYHPLL
jgi:hypothetical protein